ncbi:MAG TPA: efflux transporter outer membrane subunit [Gammaproteobacteria bacterium]|nr:efflux transporter outer membrane subunit [Gammaproteobacteria bacterium]
MNKVVRGPALAGVMLLAGCMVGPDYQRPDVETPAAFKEAVNGWQPARPKDDLGRGEWWTIYGDPILDGLEGQINISNQNIKAAEAAFRLAQAVIEQTRASLYPTVGVNGSSTSTGGDHQKSPTTQYNLAATASWVPDLWGRIRRTIESNTASAQAGAADLASAQLSAQSALASDYFALRSQDDLKNLLDATIVNDSKALQIVKNQYAVGVAARADIIQAETQLLGVQAQAVNVGVQRAQLEHAIAVLIGKPPAGFSLAPDPLAGSVPVMPTVVPSALLERRPDIASAERKMAAANAQIGVATAAWFPDLTLSASSEFSSSMLAKLLQASNSLWALGPLLAETVFDAGARSAAIKQSRANYDETVATYRQTVLTAFQQVEDQLAALRILAQQSEVETALVASAQKAEQLVLNQYKGGIVPYSSVLTAETTTLSSEQAALAVRQNRFLASVALIEALGGSWDVSQLEISETGH